MLSSTADSSKDLISDLLLGMRINGVSYHRLQLTHPFGLSIEKSYGQAHFYFIAQGQALLSCADNRYFLHAGDVLLMPQGIAHQIQSSPELPCLPISTLPKQPLYQQMTEISTALHQACDDHDTIIFKGCMDFDLGNMQALITAMPVVMLVSNLMEKSPELQALLDAIGRESRTKRAGYAGIISKLADAIAAIIVRNWVENGCEDTIGWVKSLWLKALNQPRLGKAIMAMHSAPEQNWTVAELAKMVGYSRSIFAKRFTEATGISPIIYLTELRMRLAAQWITQGNSNIENIAYRLGYQSLAAFSRAFKRTIGKSPTCLKVRTQKQEIAQIIQPEKWPCRTPAETL